MQADWELSQTLASDFQGVRCAAVLASDASTDDAASFRIVTGSQVGSLCEYAVPSGDITPLPFQHDHAVTALLSSSIKKNDKNDSAIYVTGCKDAQIRIFSASNHSLVATLKGHEKPVTSLAWCDPKQRYLVSGSWDGTARIWNVETHALVATLPNHENSVCVTGIAAGDGGDVLTIATGSAGMAQNNVVAGHSVRLWQVHVHTGETKLLQTVANDHDGPIRDICTCNASSNEANLMIATCSNDGTVKLRDAVTGKAESTLVFVQEQQAHPPMLLSVVCSNSDDHNSASSPYLAASAEDGHVVVWDFAAQQQQGLPQILRHATCVWNVIALPNGDLATCCDDGSLRIFTRATERMADVQQRQQFAQDVQDALNKTKGGPTPDEVAKLPRWEYNGDKQGTSEGQVQLFQKNGVAIAAQWSVASQTWIEVGEVTGQADTGQVDGVTYDHVFPIEVDQTGGGGVANLKIGYNNGENPFVAAQRFIDAHMLPQHHLAEIANYIQQRAGQQQPTTLGATAPAAAVAGTPIVSYEYLPMKSYKGFELSEKTATTTLEKMKNKIVVEFGWKDNLDDMDSLMATLVASNRYHSSKISDAELSVIAKMLETLPVAQAFPALDLARLTVLHPDAASSSRASYWQGVVQKVMARFFDSADNSLAIPMMLSLRLFANAFKGGPGSRDAVVSNLPAILDCVQQNVQSTNKNIRLSVATVLFNACFCFRQQQQSCPDNVATKMVSIFNEIVSAKTYETEALVRTLVALGTLAMTNPAAKETAKTLYLASKVEPAASPHGDPAKSIAKEVYSVLQ